MFGSSDDEFLTFADFGSRVNIWNLNTGRSVEVKDPKSHIRERGYAFRPKSGHLAILCRSGPQDVLVLIAQDTREVIWTAALPMIDAQGLTWSPDGMFLVVSESASLGSNACVYTAAGDLYRTYSGEGAEDLQMGIKSLQWSPKSDMIAVSSYDRRVRLLNTRTVSRQREGMLGWRHIANPDSLRLSCTWTTMYLSLWIRRQQSGKRKSPGI